MTIIIASDARDEAADPRPEDQHRAETLEAERAKATAGPAVRADGGETREELPPVDVGDHVEDRDDLNATMLVVRTPLEPANEVDARNGKTVAECNPDYPADDDVVVVKFPGRTSVELSPLQGYAYPRSRLRITSRLHDRDDDRDGGEE